MNKSNFLFILLPILLLNKESIEGKAFYEPAKAWYEYSGPYKVDKHINEFEKGKVYFEVNINTTPFKTTDADFNSRYVNSKEYFTAFLVNATDTTAYIGHQDGSLIMIQEAIDKNGKWAPIEYWYYSWCGNSYFGGPEIAPDQYVIVPIKKRTGNYKTKVRLRLKFGSHQSGAIIYSNPFDMSIDSELLKMDPVDSLLNDTSLRKLQIFQYKSYLDQ